MPLKINEDCIACGTCADACPVNAIAVVNDNFSIGEDCTECQLCIDSCPVSAIVD